MISMIHSGDFHLEKTFEHSSLPSKYAGIRRKDIWSTVENLISESISRQADYLVLSGDIYEQEYFTRSDLARFYSLLMTTPSKVLLVAGNHDPLGPGSLYDQVERPANLHIFMGQDPQVLEEEKVCFHGLSYPASSFRSNFLSQLRPCPDKLNVLIAHSDIIHPNDKYLPLDKKDLLRLNFDYIALGHIHKPTIVAERIIYPGSPEPLSFNETGPHGALYLELGQGIKYEFLDVSRSIYLEEVFNLDDGADFYQLVHEVKKKISDIDKKIYLRVKLEGDRTSDSLVDPMILEEALAPSCHYVEVEDRRQEVLDMDRVYQVNKDNIIGHFIENMRKKDLKDPIQKDALKLGVDALLKRGIR